MGLVAQLSLLAFPRESNLNFPWEKFQLDNAVVKKREKKEDNNNYEISGEVLVISSAAASSSKQGEKKDEGLMLIVIGSLVAVSMLVALIGGLCYIKRTHLQIYSKLPSELVVVFIMLKRVYLQIFLQTAQ